VDATKATEVLTTLVDAALKAGGTTMPVNLCCHPPAGW
jgi:hypothetical protein